MILLYKNILIDGKIKINYHVYLGILGHLNEKVTVFGLYYILWTIDQSYSIWKINSQIHTKSQWKRLIF